MFHWQNLLAKRFIDEFAKMLAMKVTIPIVEKPLGGGARRSPVHGEIVAAILNNNCLLAVG